MLATLGGLLALPLGLSVLLLPLLAPELSRPRDSAWGAVLLLLGLDLVTSADRLTGAPMLGVLCGALLIGRLGLEVGQGRWRQLTEEERQRLGSLERWSTSFRQLGITSAGLLEQAGAGIGRLGSGFAALKGGGDGAPTAAVAQGGGPSRSGGKRKGKRWVRPESPVPSPTADAAPGPTTAGPAAGDAETNPASQDVARPDGSGSRPATPAPELTDDPPSPAKGPGRFKSEPTATTAAAPPRPSVLLPAPAAKDQAPEPATHGLAEPESPSPTAAPEPATPPPSSSELVSGA
jgi:hypothetical protein